MSAMPKKPPNPLLRASRAFRKAEGLGKEAPPTPAEADALAGWTGRQYNNKAFPKKIKDAMIEKVYFYLEGGDSIYQALAKVPNAPSATMFRRWIRELPQEKQDNLLKQRIEGYMMWAEEIHDIANTPMLGKTTKTTQAMIDGKLVTTETVVTEADMLGHRQLQIATRKWALAKMLPKLFGERLVLDAPDGLPFVDSLRELSKKLPG